MKHHPTSFAAGLVLAAFGSLLAGPAAPAAAAPYHVARVLHLGGAGNWDYATLDAAGERLYLPRTTHTQVVSTATGKLVGDVPGLQHGHGVALVPRLHRGFVTDGDAGTVQVFDLATFKVSGTLEAGDDADGITYDAASDRVIAVCGDARTAVPIRPDVDPALGHAEAPIPLGGKPEGIALDGHGKAYIALEDRAQVAVLDTRAGKVVGRWATPEKPVGMAYDPATGRVFVACRSKVMVVLDSRQGGRVLAKLPIGEGVDAAAFGHGRAFASCWDGTLTVVGERRPGALGVLQVLKTQPGARTLAYDGARDRAFLPTADQVPGKPYPRPVPGTFRVLEVAGTP